MGLLLRWLSLVAVFCASPVWVPAWAEGWTRDAWHFVTEDSPFHTPERKHLHAAAILQEDGRFALLVLGTPQQGAVVSINLPGTEPAEKLTSTLVIGNGGMLTREISGEQLKSSITADGRTVTYTFRIPPADLESFMAAKVWRVRSGDALTTMTLKGSRDAISTALEARKKTLEEITRQKD